MCKWTLDTLRVHLNSKIEGNDLRYQQRFDAQQLAIKDAMTAQKELAAAAILAADKATVKAEDAANKRFDSVNEFRGALSDLGRTMMSRSEAEARFGALLEKIDGPNGITRQVERNAGKGMGLHAGWGYLFAGVMMIVAVVSLFVRFGAH